MTFKSKKDRVVLDQIITVDKVRLVKKLGSIDSDIQEEVLSTLTEIFAP
jgi:mRNA interferase MazF